MKKLIFDFDGTLLNSSSRHIVVLEDCLNDSGYFEFSLSDYLTFKAGGYSTFEYLRKRLNLSEDISEEISSAWVKNIEREYYLKKDFLYEDAVPTLRICSEIGYQLYLISARKHESSLIKQLQNLKIISFFHEIYCVPNKNAADAKTAHINRVNADLVIGDTEVDWKAALKAQVPYYILNRGFRNKTYWDSLGVKSFDSLEYIFNENKIIKPPF